jgi:TM2 domain-containing membrane protein YozV
MVAHFILSYNFYFKPLHKRLLLLHNFINYSENLTDLANLPDLFFFFYGSERGLTPFCPTCSNKMPFMCRYVAGDLASDIVVSIGDMKFYLHKVCSNLSTISNFELKFPWLLLLISWSFKCSFIAICVKSYKFKYNSIFLFIYLRHTERNEQ